jgi:transcription elongation factor Elf1
MVRAKRQEKTKIKMTPEELARENKYPCPFCNVPREVQPAYQIGEKNYAYWIECDCPRRISIGY